MEMSIKSLKEYAAEAEKLLTEGQEFTRTNWWEVNQAACNVASEARLLAEVIEKTGAPGLTATASCVGTGDDWYREVHRIKVALNCTPKADDNKEEWDAAMAQLKEVVAKLDALIENH